VAAVEKKKRVRPRPVDSRILAAVTRRGRRLTTLAELTEEGEDQVSEKAVLRRVRSGVLQRVYDGVYLVGAGDLTREEEYLAIVLAGGPTALASGFTTLELAGLEAKSKRPQVTVSWKTSFPLDTVDVRRTRRSLPWETLKGVPSVTVAQGLLDVAARLPERDLHKFLTTAWRKRLTTPRAVLDHIEKYGGRGVKGTRRLRGIAEIYDGVERGPGSEAEADFLFDLFAELDRAGIERPELQFVIDVRDGREKVVPDFVWPRRRKVVEMKGLKAHGDYLKQDEDVERESAIRAAGWDLDCLTPRAMRERRKQTIARVITFLQTPNAHWPG
jgi:hypothetical protein